MKYYLHTDGKYVFSKVWRSEFGSDILNRWSGGVDILKNIRKKRKGKIVVTVTQEQYDDLKRSYMEKPFVTISVSPDELIEMGNEAKQRIKSLNKGRKKPLGLCFSHIDDRVTLAFFDKKLPRLEKRAQKKVKKNKGGKK